jgi:hypothetical protein
LNHLVGIKDWAHRQMLGVLKRFLVGSMEVQLSVVEMGLPPGIGPRPVRS